MYRLAYNDIQQHLMVDALELLINLNLGNWGVVLDHAPKLMFDVPEGTAAIGDHPTVEIPADKTADFRKAMASLGSEFIGADPGVTLDLRTPGIPPHVITAHELSYRIAGSAVLVLSEHEAVVLRHALDIYSRLRIGQWGPVAQHSPRIQYPRTEDEQPRQTHYSKTHQYRDMLRRYGAQYINFAPNASYGIFSDRVEDSARQAYDIKQVLRHRVAWDRNPEGGHTIPFDKPWHSSKEGVPLPIFIRICEE